ncbi:MBOAT family protein [Pedobacter psychrodurus]|uniref:MBOAT family protein n=1 Tax=Pedobacter psychrodurus TaxID=2530456 RepID=A0A4V6N6L5_9SPHI|nr:MBOAT family O-acyltransferase [Pedobacter psychrodurus]TCD28958.1 MBOAT family protein [Pedobacter psychrodurus]
MLFNSLSFVFFFVAVFAIYYLPFVKKWQLPFLVIVSTYFYGTAYWKATAILLISILVNTIISYKVSTDKKQNVKAWLFLGIAFNLATLFFFKYIKLFTLTFIDSSLHAQPFFHFLILVPLPIGVSFFTFEGISLLVDSYKQKEVQGIIKNQSFYSHFIRSSLFISFFPHLIAGPILKADQFIPQIGIKYFKNINWEKVFKQLILGYFLKMVVADNLKDITADLIYPFEIYHPITLITLLFGYSIQIFADFAGYSLIALGLASLLGYDLINNFNFPYISKSFSEFWTRWHISLSRWLKEYLYIPLGGNRKGVLRTYFNLFIVMFLGGLWHGATWNFALWGTVHGLAIAIERLISNYFKPNNTTWYKALKVILVFTVVSFAWLFFKLLTIHEVVNFYKALAPAYWHGFTLSNREWYVFFYCLPVLFYYILYLLRNRYTLTINKLEPFLYAVLLFLILSNAGFSGNFIYFRF